MTDAIFFSGVIGVLHANVYFWIFFTSLHILSCLFLSIQIYYMGRWKMDRGIFFRVWVIVVNDTKALCAGMLPTNNGIIQCTLV